METKKDKKVEGAFLSCSPFGGIPRNWKLFIFNCLLVMIKVPPSGGSLEIGNNDAQLAVYLNLIRFPLRGDP